MSEQRIVKINDEAGIELKLANPTYVYMIIPAEYVCVYHKLLVMLTQFGIDMLDDCSATCKGNNKNVVTCWNMFQAACAAYQLDETSKANVLINYIKGQLNIIYQGSEHEQYDGTFVVPVDEEGKLKAVVSCEDQPKFYIDASNGQLTQITDEDKTYTHNYLLDDGDGY